MSIINQNSLFDKLKEYIDHKIGIIETNLRELFEEYGLKEILPYLDEIKIVADNIDIIQPIGEHIDDIVKCADDIDAIIAAPDHVDSMEALVAQSQVLFDGTVEYNGYAHDWAMEEFNIEVDDGIHAGFSSYHWAIISKMYAEGLEFMGTWSPLDGAYPDNPAHGQYWLVRESGWFDNQQWYVADKLIYISIPDMKGFYRIPNLVSWSSIFDKPSLFPPIDHYHSEYQELVNMIDRTEGPTSTGKGVKLNDEGMVDNSMIKLPIIYLVGSWIPTTNNEYPDTGDYTPGATWIITGLQSYGWTFQTGDLIGQASNNGDFMMWTAEGWHLRKDKLYPEMYYKRDGSYPMTGNVNFANWRGVACEDPIDDTDVANKRSVNALVDNMYSKDDFVDFSYGQTSIGEPVKLNRYGLIDASMLTLNSLTYQGGWNPTGSMGEYPEVTKALPGYFWDVYGADDNAGYTFSTGDLAGKTVFNGYYMVWGQVSWSIIKVDMTPDLYYKLDGSTPLTGPFNGGLQTISMIADGISDTDGTTIKQLYDGLATKANTLHEHNPADITPQGVGSLLDADLLDGHHAIDFAEQDHVHAPGDIQPQGADSGLDADLLDGYQASTLPVSDLMQDALDDKSDISHTHTCTDIGAPCGSWSFDGSILTITIPEP